jgi:hypothetical protein
MFWGKLEDAVPDASHCVGNAKQFVWLRRSAWHQLAVLTSVKRSARSGKTKCASAKGLFGEQAHLGDVIGGCVLVGGAAVAHNKGSQRAVRNLGSEVDDVRASL